MTVETPVAGELTADPSSPTLRRAAQRMRSAADVRTPSLKIQVGRQVEIVEEWGPSTPTILASGYRAEVFYASRAVPNPLERLRRLIPAISEGRLAEPEPEMLSLARRALERMEANRDEDLDEWADQIGRDIAKSE